jgi:hypothetical protein
MDRLKISALSLSLKQFDAILPHQAAKRVPDSPCRLPGTFNEGVWRCCRQAAVSRSSASSGSFS